MCHRRKVKCYILPIISYKTHPFSPKNILFGKTPLNYIKCFIRKKRFMNKKATKYLTITYFHEFV